jgi:tetratricopeptide (TPR) repeat protein
VSDIGENSETGLAASCADLDACRLRLDSENLSDQDRAQVYCRLSEALYHSGSRDNALACARIAFSLYPGSEVVANLCAWVFSNCGQHAEAAAAYERLLEMRPDWAEGHRHASGSFAVAGQIEPAILHGTMASDLDATCFEFAFHVACLLETAGRYARSVTTSSAPLLSGPRTAGCCAIYPQCCSPSIKPNKPWPWRYGQWR